MRDVAVIGAGLTRFGERWEHGLRELIAEAGMQAITDANIESKDIQIVYGSTMASGRFVGQEHLAALLADQMGFKNVPAVGRECMRQRRERGKAGIHCSCKRHVRYSCNRRGGEDDRCHYGRGDYCAWRSRRPGVGARSRHNVSGAVCTYSKQAHA